MALREGTAAVPVQVTCEAGEGACARPEWGAAAEAARKAPKAWGGHVDPGVPSFRLAGPCPVALVPMSREGAIPHRP